MLERNGAGAGARHHAAGATARTIAEHLGILDALRRGDSSLAEHSCLTHIAGIEE